jgi:hypothetical protein
MQVYDPSIIPPLVQTLQASLEKPGSEGIIALTTRKEETIASFLHQAGTVSPRSWSIDHLSIIEATFSHLLISAEELVVEEVFQDRVEVIVDPGLAERVRIFRMVKKIQ